MIILAKSVNLRSTNANVTVLVRIVRNVRFQSQLSKLFMGMVTMLTFGLMITKVGDLALCSIGRLLRILPKLSVKSNQKILDNIAVGSNSLERASVRAVDSEIVS